MKKQIPVFIIIAALCIGCSTSNSDVDKNVYYDQIGTLKWAGSPAADGAGMLFIVDDKEYGAPGTPSDYPNFFNENTLEVKVTADFKLTGKKTSRGWGVTFPEIKFIEIKKR